MVEELYYTFMELLERGKQSETETTTGKGKGKGRSKSKTADNHTEEQIKGQQHVDDVLNGSKEETKENDKKDK